MQKEHETAMLLARLGDAVEKRQRGSVAVLPFLTPLQRRLAERELKMRGEADTAWFFGGYPTAERVCLFLLPDYLEDMRKTLADEIQDSYQAVLAEDLTAAVCAVRILGSGYRKLTHRDYLGSILGLGLERDALGDIAPQNDFEAVVFCSARMSDFLCENLRKVANDTVKCRPYTLDEGFTDGRQYQPVTDTVASARLDCVVAALTDLSREDAQNAIRTGLVEVEFEEQTRTDLPLVPPLTLSVRGYGRYILRSFDGETRRGRLRMRADRLI